MKQSITAVFFISLVIGMAGCPNNTPDPDNTYGNPSATGTVTFFNESSYYAIIHQDVFSGPVLLELAPGELKTVTVRASDNYGVGSTFSIEYEYLVVDETDLADGKVSAKGIDPDVQLNQVIEANRSYTIQIPQPAHLEFPTAFVKILNVSELQFELRNQGEAFKQAGSGNLPVPPGKTGVYEFSSTPEGKVISGYTVRSTFQSVTIPDFTAKTSYIYNFIYNGTSVVKTGEYKIVF